MSDNAYANLVNRYKIAEHVLTECYRQKQVVGRAVQASFESIALSSAFFRGDKVEKFRRDHEAMTNLSNRLAFVNRGGYSKSYLPVATLADLRRELDRVITGYPRWIHWPSIVAMVDSDSRIPKTWMAELQRAQAEVIDQSRIQDIKGLEYQHAFLFLGPDLQKRIGQVVNGQGQKGYFDTRLLRIPISRAKDSVVVFGLT